MRQFTHNDEGHFVQFYKDEEFLYKAVERYFNSAFAEGAVVVVVATPAHLRAFEERLVRSGHDLENLKFSGRYIALDARETLARFMAGGDPDKTLFEATLGPVIEGASVDGTYKVKVYGEMVDILWQEGKPHQAITLESYWNDLARLHAFTLFCAYYVHNLNHVSAESNQEVRSLHTSAVQEY